MKKVKGVQMMVMMMIVVMEESLTRHVPDGKIVKENQGDCSKMLQ